MSEFYGYIVGLAGRLGVPAGARFLDYGCGAGQIVDLAVQRGYDAYGVEKFYEGGSYHAQAAAGPHWQTRISPLTSEDRIPMESGTFDVVISNQVFEHIDDFTLPLAEIGRVLKPGGLFINVFPSRAVWREGHIGIPFSHRMARGSRLRHGYVLLLRKLGLGYNKAGRTPEEWTRHCLDWIDAWTFYKPLPAIVSTFGRDFTVSFYEGDYLAYRIGRSPRLRFAAPLARQAFMRPVLNWLCARLAGHVFVLRKR